MNNFKITVYLSSPLAQEAPSLDALLEYIISFKSGIAKKFTRSDKLEPIGNIRIPIIRKKIGGYLISKCSNPIYKYNRVDKDFLTKQLSTEHSKWLEEKQRKNVSKKSGAYKSIRKPIKISYVDKIVWFCMAGKEIKKLLKCINSIGSYKKIGYGLISSWEFENIDKDYSWYAEENGKKILMRTLPLCDELPKNLIGYRKSFGALAPPYWHRDRMTEIVEPI